jgi:hypothetical protein
MKKLDVPQSGSLAGTTASRNRYGQYNRTRAIPVNPSSTAQGTMRARLAASAAAWRGLTDLQRTGWESLALQMSRADSLGQSYTLNGFGAFVSVNQNQANAGNAALDDAPALVTPDAVVTLALTATAATLSAVYTVTPLPSGARLFVYASPQRSAGRGFEGDLRLTHVSAAAAASPANIFTAYQARFGTPVVGNKIFIAAHVYLGGFRSGPALTSAIVTA